MNSLYNQSKIILSLCDYTGIWSEPYRKAGYNVIRLDIKNGKDIRLFKFINNVHGVIAQPPCTHLAVSGARWWKQKGEKALLEALSLVDACTRIILVHKPKWWVLENPVGRLVHYIGPVTAYYHPYEFALLSDTPDEEAYTKKTGLWGNFTMPTLQLLGRNTAITPFLGSKMINIPPSKDRADIRSKTPQGFARAFFEVNP